MMLSDLRLGLHKVQKAFASIDDSRRGPEEADITKLRIGLNRLSSRITTEQAAGRWRRVQFCPFAALRRERDENLHSDLLRWLLDPEESHGLGRAFLDSFFRNAMHREPPPYGQVAVTREVPDATGRPDLVVTTDSWYLVIENKIDHSESPGQTKKYAARWDQRARFMKTKAFYVLLTTHGNLPDCHRFCSITYNRVCGILQGLPFAPNTRDFMLRVTEHLRQLSWEV